MWTNTTFKILFLMIPVFSFSQSSYDVNVSLMCDIISETESIDIIKVSQLDSRGNELIVAYYDTDNNRYTPSGNAILGSCSTAGVGGCIDTFFLANGFYNIVCGGDTLTAPFEVNLGELAFLSNSGSDLTAVVGDPSKPFSTIQAAFNALSPGGVMVVSAGENYVSPDFIFGNASEKDVLIDVSSGATFQNSGGPVIIDFNFSANYNFRVFGGGELILSNPLNQTFSPDIDLLASVSSISSGTGGVASIFQFISNVSPFGVTARNLTDVIVVSNIPSGLDSINIGIYVDEAIFLNGSAQIINFNGLSNSSVSIRYGSITSVRTQPVSGTQNVIVFSNSITNSSINIDIDASIIDWGTNSVIFNNGAVVTMSGFVNFENSVFNVNVNCSCKGISMTRLPNVTNAIGSNIINITGSFLTTKPGVIIQGIGAGLDTDNINTFVDVSGITDTIAIFSNDNFGDGGFYGNVTFSGYYKTSDSHAVEMLTGLGGGNVIFKDVYFDVGGDSLFSNSVGDLEIRGNFSFNNKEFGSNIDISYPTVYYDRSFNLVEVSDSDLNVSEAQVLNRSTLDIVSSISPGAGSDVTIDLPTPSATYVNRIIRITSVDGNGSFDINLEANGTSILFGNAAFGSISLNTDVYTVQCRENLINGNFNWYLK